MKLKLSFIALFIFSLSFVQAQMSSSAAFEVSVSGQGDPLFLIPGAGCAGEVWETTVARYAKDYTCHVFTLAGYGGVPALAEAPYLPQIKTDLAAYIQEHGEDKAILIGHSIGGYLSLWLGSEYPDLFQKIIVVDGLPFLAAAQNPFATEEQVKQYMEPNLDSYKTQDDKAFAEQQMAVLKSMIQSEEHIATAMKWSLASDKKMLSYSVFEMMCHDLRQEIKNIKAPTLVLGAYDGPYDWAPQFTKEVATKTYEQQYANHSNCTVLIPDHTRHFVMFDNPDWYFEQLDNFLNPALSEK